MLLSGGCGPGGRRETGGVQHLWKGELDLSNFGLGGVILRGMLTRLIQLMGQLPRCPVVLLGDIMLDRYIYGNAERLSPEAPVPVLHYQQEQCRLGGAGNVVANLATLGAQVRPVGIIGQDEAARQVLQQMAGYGVNPNSLLQVDDRPTVCKVRLVGLAQHRHPQQMLRLDYEDSNPINPNLADKLLARVETALDGAAVLCIEDYGKGLLTPQVCQQVIALAHARRVPVLIDPAAIGDYSRYVGATALKMNRMEARKASGLPVDSAEQYSAAATRLLEQLQLEAVVITLDKSGSYLATRDGQRQLFRTRARQVYDVTGAGDMVLSMLAMARAAGASWGEAVALGNVAGGLEVERFGAVPVTVGEIIQELLVEARQKLGKQRSLEQLLGELERHRAAGKKVVFTNGCFDLIHLGHVKYFQHAKAQGDILVVGVNTDGSIQRLKGPKRPIINQQDRVGVLEELESIDYVVMFEDDTPLRLIQAIRPDVLAKGADYTREQVVGHDVVESYGGRVELVPLVDGKSTSTVIQRILEAYK